MKYAIDVPAGTVTLVFDHGTKVVMTASEIHESCRMPTLLYGMRQKVMDKAAGALKAAGVDPTEAEVERMREKMVREMWSRMIDGSAFTRSGDGIGRVSYLAEAVRDLYGITLDEARAKVASLSDENRKGLEANPKVAARVAAIRAEVAAKKAAEAQEKAEGDEEDELPEL